MNQISPFKSSAFRITLVYVVLFGISVSIILGFIYWSTIVYKTQQTDDDINAEILELTEVYEQKGYPGLVILLSERIERLRPGDPTLYLLTDHRYQPLVGNIYPWPKVARDVKEGWLEFRLEDGERQGVEGEFTARAKTFVVENRFNLLVGQGIDRKSVV